MANGWKHWKRWAKEHDEPRVYEIMHQTEKELKEQHARISSGHVAFILAGKMEILEDKIERLQSQLNHATPGKE